MAQSKNNIITHGLSGKVGDLLVFSQRNGKTVVSKAPKERSGEATANQKAYQLKFQKAVLYAKSVLADPAKKKPYDAVAESSAGINTYNVAVADFLKAPKIESIDLSLYNGNPGDRIKITVTDDFAVLAVRVKIENADGTLVEEGNAIQDSAAWHFTSTVPNPDLSGDKITVTATDTPDNLSEQTQII